MNLYLDTSALVKRYIRERGSQEVAGWIADADLSATSVIALVEAAAAFARASKMGGISPKTGERAVEALSRQWAAYIRIQPTQKLIDQAANLAWRLGLRGYDAVHLASAEAWQSDLGQPIALVTYDQQLAAAGKRLGLIIWPDD